MITRTSLHGKEVQLSAQDCEIGVFTDSNKILTKAMENLHLFKT